MKTFLFSTQLALLVLCSTVKTNAQVLLHMDGVNDKITLPVGNGVLGNFSTPHHFTIEMRAKLHQLNGIALLSKHAPPASGFFIETNSAGTLSAGFGYNWDYSRITYGTALETNRFYHFAISYHMNTNSFKFYVDGILVGTQPLPNVYYPNTVNPISIGASDHWGSFGNLSVDYARVWNGERSDADLATYAHQEVACNSTGLMANYNFNEGTPNGNNQSLTQAVDCSTGGYGNATLSNFALTGNASNYIGSSNVATGRKFETAGGGTITDNAKGKDMASSSAEIQLQGNSINIASGDTKIITVADCAFSPTDKVMLFTEGSKVYRLPKASDHPGRIINFISRNATSEVYITTSNAPLSTFVVTYTTNQPSIGSVMGGRQGATTSAHRNYDAVTFLQKGTSVTLMSNGKVWFGVHSYNADQSGRGLITEK